MTTSVTVKIDDCPILIDEGSQWMHIRKVVVYEVVCVTNTEADDAHKERFPVTVVFKDTQGRVWSLSPEEFLKERARI